MSNNNSFGGKKLKKVLASMCSFVVGASGVSQAGDYLENPKDVDFKSAFGISDGNAAFIGDDGSFKDLFNIYLPLTDVKKDFTEISLKFFVFSGDIVSLSVCNRKGESQSRTDVVYFPISMFFSLVELYRENMKIDLGAELAKQSGNVNARKGIVEKFLVWMFNCSDWNQLRSKFTYVDKSANGYESFGEIKDSKSVVLRKGFWAPGCSVFYAEIAKHVGVPAVKEMLAKEVKKFTDYETGIKTNLLDLAKAVEARMPSSTEESKKAKAEFIKSVCGAEKWDEVDLKDKNVDEMFTAISAGVNSLEVTGVSSGVPEALAMLGGGNIKVKVEALKNELLNVLNITGGDDMNKSVEVLLGMFKDRYDQVVKNQKNFGGGAVVGSGLLGAAAGAGITVGANYFGMLSLPRGKKKRSNTRPGKPVVNKQGPGKQVVNKQGPGKQVVNKRGPGNKNRK